VWYDPAENVPITLEAPDFYWVRRCCDCGNKPIVATWDAANQRFVISANGLLLPWYEASRYKWELG
jgi:hypothetical protein